MDDMTTEGMLSLEKPPTSRHLAPEDDAALPLVHFAGKMTADGYQPVNWQWLDVLTEADPAPQSISNHS